MGQLALIMIDSPKVLAACKDAGTIQRRKDAKTSSMQSR